MIRLSSLTFRVAVAAIFLCSGVNRGQAQEPTPPPTTQEPGKGPAKEQAKEPEKEPEEEQNPFAPKPAPPLPAGMIGSDTNDPRFKLAPGLYDAGEAAVGIQQAKVAMQRRHRIARKPQLDQVARAVDGRQAGLHARHGVLERL